MCPTHWSVECAPKQARFELLPLSYGEFRLDSLRLVVFGGAVAFMSFFAIERDRWSIAGYNPPPGARGIEPALWAALMGVFLVLVGVFPWEPFRARRKQAKRIENLQAGRRPAARIRR